MPSRFSEVVHNKLFRGSYPEPADLPILKDSWGIQLIVSLDERLGKKIAPECKRLGIEQIILPIHEYEENGRDLILDKIDGMGVTNIIGDKTAYVHCRHGKDRTGTFIARYRTENGWTAKKAIQEALKFGFGLGVDDHSVGNYLRVINNGPDAGEPVGVDFVRSFLDGKIVCDECGMIKEDNVCDNCEQIQSFLPKDIVTDTREASLSTFQNPGESTEAYDVSNLWSSEETTTTASKKTMNTKLRRGIVAELYQRIKNANEMSSQQISQKVSDGDKETTEKLIEYLDKFNNLIDILVGNQIAPFIDLFTNTQGITFEIIKEMCAEKHFVNFGKNLKKNIWRLVGDRYVDIADDIDKNKEIKEHTGQDGDDNKKTMFDLCLEGLEKFNKDTHIGPMEKSLEDAVKGLADLVIEFSDYMENKLENKDMQQAVLSYLKTIKEQTETIKSLVKDRLIYTLNKDVLGKERSYSDQKGTTSVLKDIILETQKGNNGIH